MDTSMHLYTFTAPLWLWSNGEKPGSWYFITVPAEVSAQIKAVAQQHARKGRGSVKVEARIGFVKWVTSIFPESKSGNYLLPVKAQVRTSLHIVPDDQLSVEILLLV